MECEFDDFLQDSRNASRACRRPFFRLDRFSHRGGRQDHIRGHIPYSSRIAAPSSSELAREAIYDSPALVLTVRFSGVRDFLSCVIVLRECEQQGTKQRRPRPGVGSPPMVGNRNAIEPMTTALMISGVKTIVVSAAVIGIVVVPLS
jgi:hypothetical protein